MVKLDFMRYQRLLAFGCREISPPPPRLSRFTATEPSVMLESTTRIAPGTPSIKFIPLPEMDPRPIPDLVYITLCVRRRRHTRHPGRRTIYQSMADRLLHPHLLVLTKIRDQSRLVVW